MARPAKYLRKFHPGDFIRLSKGGKTLTQIALAWNVHRDTIYEWARRHKEFSDAIKKGRAFAEGWYMDLGQAAMVGEAKYDNKKINLNLGMFVWLTKNLFKWSDKIDQTVEVENQLNITYDTQFGNQNANAQAVQSSSRSTEGASIN